MDTNSTADVGGMNTTLNNIEEEVNASEEVAHVSNDASIMGSFQLINEESLDPKTFCESRKTWKGESSTKRVRSIQIIVNVSGSRLRSVIPMISNSITDIYISNCNKRIRGPYNDIEEIRLRGIAKR